MTTNRCSNLCLLLGFALFFTGCEKLKSSMGMTDAAPDPNLIAAQKFAKYSKVQDDLATLHPFSREMEEYLSYNPELESKEKLETYSARTDPFNSAIFLLNDAMSVKADLGPADAAATKLMAALQALNPTVKEMQTYANTHAVETDGGAKARQIDPIYRQQMKDASGAAREFEHALSEKGLELDTAHLKTLKPDTIEYHVIETNLATRRAVDTLGDLTTTNSPQAKAAFLASLDPVARADKGLADALAQYKGTAAIDHCKLLQTQTAKLLAKGKDVADSPVGKAHIGTKADAFVNDYNATSSEYSYCLRDVTTGSPALH